MANYGENFRGLKDQVQCDLCATHLDNKKMSFENCHVLKKNIDMSGKYCQIFSASVPSSLVNTLVEMDKFREESKVL